MDGLFFRTAQILCHYIDQLNDHADDKNPHENRTNLVTGVIKSIQQNGIQEHVMVFAAQDTMQLRLFYQ